MLVKNHDYWVSLAAKQIEQGQNTEALYSCNEAMKLKNDSTEALYYIGNAYMNLEQYQDCINIFTVLLKMDPKHARAWWAIAYSYYMQKNLEQAYKFAQEALSCDPSLPFVNLIIAFYYEKEKHQTKKAIEYYKKEISQNPAYEKAYGFLSSALMSCGKQEQAIDALKQQLKLNSENSITHDNRIMYHHYITKATAQDLLELAQDYARNILKTLPKPNQDFSNIDLNPNKTELKIGFVSGDFKKHAIFAWLNGLFDRVKEHNLEIILFANNKEDEASEVLKKQADKWINIDQKTDQESFDLIRENRIDILVDLSGHTGLNRLKLFALKPAPVQVTWLGMAGPTGVAAMDYMLSDKGHVLENEDKFYNEKIYRLDRFFAPYAKPHFDIDLQIPPSSQVGYVTFGSFNNFMKVNHEVLKTWAVILNELPNSKMIFKSRCFSDLEFQEEIKDFFETHGINQERLTLEGFSRDKKDYCRRFNDIDIHLDPFPAGGGTTSLDCLWMSTPYVSLYGNKMPSRTSSVILKNAGHEELVAYNLEDYQRKILQLANDSERIRAYKNSLRADFLASSICDELGYARDLSHAFFDMWRNINQKD